MSISLYASKKTHKNLSYETSISLLQQIDKDAIVLGTGEKRLYVFIDPLCPHSRKFIKMVSKNPKMLSKYQYQLFLYSIPRLKSTNVVSAIYRSKDPIETLLQVMVKDKKHHQIYNEMTKTKVDRIVSLAQEIGVHKRPFIYVIK